jgi:acetyl-CoA carboxylase beta subunit
MKKRKKWIRVGHRAPGRPKGSRNRKKEDLSGVRIVKALGHCQKCEVVIAETDLITKKIYVCPHCHHRARTSTLKPALNRERPTSKKEYLENTLNATHIDTSPLLKVIEEMPDLDVIQEDEHE